MLQFYSCAGSLISILQVIHNELLTAYPSGDYKTDELSRNEPKTKPTLTLEEVRAVLAEKSRDGHTATIRGLLEKYGGTKLSEIDQSNYEELMKEAEDLT